MFIFHQMVSSAYYNPSYRNLLLCVFAAFKAQNKMLIHKYITQDLLYSQLNDRRKVNFDPLGMNHKLGTNHLRHLQLTL